MRTCFYEATTLPQPLPGSAVSVDFRAAGELAGSRGDAAARSASVHSAHVRTRGAPLAVERTPRPRSCRSRARVLRWGWIAAPRRVAA